MGDGPQAHLLPWFDRSPNAETAWADRHPVQGSEVSYSAVKRLRPWRYQRSADRHAGAARRGGHPACLPCARDRCDPLRRAVIIPRLRPRAAPGCRTTMLPTRCGRGVVMGETIHIVDNTCHDSRPSEVMTTCSTREAVERTCVKRHKPHDERFESRVILPLPLPAPILVGLLGQSLDHLPARPLLHAELRASF